MNHACFRKSGHKHTHITIHPFLLGLANMHINVIELTEKGSILIQTDIHIT